MSEDKKICKVKPTRAIVYENGHSLVYVLPCGVKYTDKHEVHCGKWERRECEYMMLETIEKQKKEHDNYIKGIIGFEE